ncbi:MAG: hypothetical protein ACXWNQ_02980 [Anaerolineales bacterium]
MSDSRNFQKIAGVSAILVTMFILGNIITLFAAVNNNTAVFSDAALLLPMGANAAHLFHVSMVFDVLAYILFSPLVMFCWSWLKQRGEGLASLYAYCGLAYSLLGALGGVILDAVLPKMIADYALASSVQQETLRLLARFFYLAIAHGVWNPLEVLMISVWFLGFGLLLRREKRGLGILALIISFLGLLDPLGWILQNDAVLNIGGIGTVLIPVWTAWFGIVLLRSPELINSTTGSRYAGQIESLS